MRAYPHRRSLAGPITLIGLGVVFLLGNLHVIAWDRLGDYFAKWWPLLLILWGAINLIEHYLAQRHGEPAPRVGGWLLIVLLIVLGLSVSSMRHAEIHMGEWDGHNWWWGGQTFNFGPQEITQDFPARASIRVVDDRGDVTVNPWDQPQIKIVYTKQISADSQDNANRADQATKPSIAVMGTTVLINANTAQSGDTRVRTDLEVFAPRTAAVQVDTSHGDVTVDRRAGNVQVATQQGDISLNDITGYIAVTLNHGDLKASNIQGDLTVDGRVQDASVSAVRGAVKFTGDYFGDLTVSKVQGGVGFHTSRTDLDLGRLDGELSMQSGEMTVSQVAGPVKVITRSKDINLREVAGDVHLENTNGSINLQSMLPLGNIEIQNRKGDVELLVPNGANFRLDAHTRRGDIESDFPGPSVNSGGNESRATGNVGTGGPTVHIDAEYGNVAIRKAG